MEGVGWMAGQDREKVNRHEDCSGQASHLSVTTEWQVPWTSRHCLAPISDGCCSAEHIKIIDTTPIKKIEDDLLPRALVVDLTSRTVSHPTTHSPDFER